MSITVTITGHDWAEVFRQAQAIAGQATTHRLVQLGDVHYADLEKPLPGMTLVGDEISAEASETSAKTEPPPPVVKPQPRKARAEKPASEPVAEPAPDAAPDAAPVDPAWRDDPDPGAEPAVAEEPEVQRLDYAQIAELALRVFREKGREVLTAIWAEFEVATGQELDPSQYGDAHTRLTEALYG
jgi:hypothetical protein